MNVWNVLLVVGLSTWGFLSLVGLLTSKLKSLAESRRRLLEERLALKERVSKLERKVHADRLKTDEALLRLEKLTEYVYTRGYTRRGE